MLSWWILSFAEAKDTMNKTKELRRDSAFSHCELLKYVPKQ